MRKTVLLLSIFTAGCVPSETLQVTANTPTTISGSSCEGVSANRCTFINSPVKLGKKEIILPGREFPFFLTEQKLKFVDASHRQWEAPIKTLTDGASIPPALVSVVGNPRAKEFINAATIHDAYCATGNEEKSSYHTRSWQLVHRMFFDALVVGGVAPVKAKIMYSGVYLGGPRWGAVKKASLETANGGSAVGGGGAGATSAQSTAATRALQSNRPLTARGVSNAKLVAAMKQAKAYVQAKNPSLNQLESYLTGLERSMLGTKSTRKATKTKSRGVEGGDGGSDGGDG